MTGRGYLKSRLAQKAAQELIINNEPILGNNSQTVQERQAISSHFAQNSEFSETSRLSSLALEDSKNLQCQKFPVSSVCRNNEVPKLCVPKIQPQSITNLQHQSIPTETLTENNAPVVCRVTENHKNNFKMTKLTSNYIKINIEEDRGLFKYYVDFDPPIDVKSTKCYLLNQHHEKIPVKAFDGTILYVPTKLLEKETILMGRLRNGTEVKMTITLKSKNSLNDRIHMYNVLFRGVMNILGFVIFGKGQYDPMIKIPLHQFQIEIWPGFVTSIDQFEDGLYMCCDVVHRVLRLETCFKVFSEVAEEAKYKNKNVTEEIMTQFCGSTIITHYNKKTYRIDDIDFKMSPLSTFLKNGSEVSYVSYYKDTYNIDIQNHQQPMIITKPKKCSITNGLEDSNICCLVPELCYLTGFTESMKNNRQLVNAIDAHTKVDPNKRQNALINLVNRINDCEKAKMKLKDWGISLFPSLTVSEGPVYKNETVILGNQLKIAVGNNMEWSMDVVKNPMFRATKMINWAILYNSRDLSTARSFCKCLAMCGPPLGMIIKEPMRFPVDGMSSEAFVTSINSAVQNNSELQLVVILFPSRRDDRYNAVKRICCAEIGIPSQVIISRTLSNPVKMRSMVQKIALQINCKLGGAGWSIDIPLNNCMIVGIDVYHEKNKQTSSVLGIVASVNKTFSQWYSVAKIQKNTHMEIADIIHVAFYEILNAYKEKNGTLPEKIIIYRDGVSDGEIKYTEEYELRNLEEYLKKYSNNYFPKVTFIIVQKRINTKIFKFLDEKYSNPSPGTVLDNTITKRNFFDFFLVSQNVRQGTVNPTHYTVLQNGCNLSTENVQRLSYKLCHMYYNWCGTIKIPAPVQYAHKLAYLVGENIKTPTKMNLSNSLYYL